MPRESQTDEQQADEQQTDEQPQAPIEYSVVAFLTDDGDKQKVQQNITATLGEHPDLACIVGMNAMHGPIIVQTLEQENKLGEIRVIAFDEEQGTLDGIEAGHIYATIAQDPYKYGFEAVRMLCSLARGGGSEVPIVGGGTFYIKAEAIRKENLQEFRDRLEARMAASTAATEP